MHVTVADVLVVLAVFWAPPAAVWITYALREVGRLRREAHELKRELRSTTAEGFPPPGPPTPDSEAEDE